MICVKRTRVQRFFYRFKKFKKFKVGEKNNQEQDFFDEFFEEIFEEVNNKYGRIEEMNVCDNIGEHMIGNVYIKFCREEDAENCVKGLESRWYIFVKRDHFFLFVFHVYDF